MPRCWWFLFHDWAEWAEYKASLKRSSMYDRLTGVYYEYDPPIDISETWEKRKCQKCGRTQHRKIRNF